MGRGTRQRRTLRRTFSILATLGLVAGLVGLSAPSASATYPGKNGHIAFATDPGTGPQVIKTIHPNGTKLQWVVSNALNPNWAPDGRTIVFERDHASGSTSCSVEISNPDGSGVIDLTGARSGCESDPSFTPDGRRVVFLRGSGIWRMNLTGGVRTLIRHVPPQVQGGDPNVSPGGGTIAFVGERKNGLRALYTVKMDGSHLSRITSFRWAAGTRIDWSPSGRRIVFTEYQDGPGNTVIVRPDGSGLKQVTHYDGDRGAGGAVYSPDGRWILYRLQNDVTSKYAIWKMHPDGSRRTRIRGLGVKFVNLDWGPEP